MKNYNYKIKNKNYNIKVRHCRQIEGKDPLEQAQESETY